MYFRALNVGMEAVCIVITAIMLFQTHTLKVKRNTDIWFRLALGANIGVVAGDMFSWLFTGRTVPGAHAVMTVANTVYFIATGIFSYAIFMYVYTYMGNKKPIDERLKKFTTAATFAQIIFVFVSMFTGTIFYISDDNVYMRGSLWIFVHVVPLAVFSAVTYAYLFTFRDQTRKEKRWFGSYLVLTLLGVLIQSIFASIASASTMFTLVMLMVNMFLNKEMDEQLRTAEQRLERERIQALQALQKKQSELTDEIIIALSNTVEAKDRYTNGHSQRVANYSREIVRRMGWSEEEQEKVYYTGLLHDVGKIRVADTIINKQSRLDDEEFEEIKLHTMAGYYILKEISSVGEFAIGARWHHERYDGRGYPNGLTGDNIPLIARIIAVADAYDAMTSNRSYRDIMPQARAREELAKGAGTQFDPEIVPIMLQMIDEDKAYRMRQPNPSVERVILAIDDDPMVHKLLEMLFRSETMYKLKTAHSGEEGLEIFRKEPVDLVLLDVEMPGMNGFDVLTKIRERKRSTPVVFMTGDKEIDIIQKAEQLGINDYLSKPLVAHILMESVQNVLINTRSSAGDEPFAEGRREYGE